MNAMLQDILKMAENWPEADQAEFVQRAMQIQARHREVFIPTDEDLRSIDEGIAAARRGDFASDEEVEAVRAKLLQK